MKKNAIGLMAILILVTFISGCTSNNNPTGNNSSIPNNSTAQNNSTENNSSMQNNQNTIVQINSDSSWSGVITSSNGTQTVSGNGNATYNLGSNPGSVSITLHKTNDAGTVTVQIIKNGNVVVSQSTSGSQGNININYSS